MSASTNQAGPIRVATRKSALAMAQSGMIADRLATLTGREAVLVEVTTYGDVTTGPLAQMGGTGVFTGAVRDAIADGQADVGVHSLKDLPTEPHAVLILAAVPQREDPRDVLHSRGGRLLADLGPGSRVGTGSPRRAAQLRRLRPDLDVSDIRGNVDTRLAKVASGDYDAIVLAYAGLSRLGRTAAISEILDPLRMISAPGQGALAVESRNDLEQTDSELFRALEILDHSDTHLAVIAERVVLNALEAGCSAPVGALGTVSGSEQARQLDLQAVVISIDGKEEVRLSVTGNANEAAQLGAQLASALIAAGAADLLGESRN